MFRGFWHSVAPRELADKRIRARFGVLGVLGLCAVALLAGCGSSTAVTARSGGERTTLDPRPAVASPAPVLAIGKSYATPRVLALDEHDGLWAWSAGEHDARVWYREQGGTAREWTIGSDAGVTRPVSPPVIAACGSRAWLGINHRIIPLDPVAGPGTPIDLAAPTTVAAVDEKRPPALQGYWAVNALGCSATRLAVGFSNGDQALLVDIASGTTTEVPLPTASEVVVAAFSGDGTAAFGLQDYEGRGPHTVLLVAPAPADPTAVALTVHDSSHLAGEADGFVVGVGEERILLGKDGPAVSRTNLDPTGLNPMYQPVPMAGGLVAAVDRGTGQLAVVDPSGRQAPRLIDLGEVTCMPTHHPMPMESAPSSTAPPTSTPATCPVTPEVFVGSTDGTIAYVPSNAQGLVQFVTVST